MDDTTVHRNYLIAWAIILAALGLYAFYQIRFLTDPWSSWIHVETAINDAVLRPYFELWNGWQSYLNVIIQGTGIDQNPARLRLVNNAVEFFDADWRRSLVAVVGFHPAFANASSIVYFLISPMLALVVARQLIGRSIFGAVAAVLAAGAFLTSLGYESAASLVFHPAKKIVIFITLLDLIAFLVYARRPHFVAVVFIGLCQLVLALSDEIGLISGLLFSGMVAVYAFLFRRSYLRDIGTLAALGAGTIVAFAYTYLSHAVLVQGSAEPPRIFEHFLFLRLFVIHAEGAFSLLYSSKIAYFLLAIGLIACFSISLAALPGIQRRFGRAVTEPDTDFGFPQSSFVFWAACLLLAINAMMAVLLLRFGGSGPLSEYNYYYGSNLSLLAFLVACSGFRVTRYAAQIGRKIPKLVAGTAQIGLAAALGSAITANAQNVPRFTKLIGLMHSDPYSYGIINQLGSESLRSDVPITERSVVRIPRCGRQVINARLVELLDELHASPQVRHDIMYLATQLGVDDRYVVAVMGMMLRRPPSIEIVDASPQQC
jgi:hypothetical protein